MTADGANFFIPIRQSSRNRLEHFGQVTDTEGYADDVTSDSLGLLVAQAAGDEAR